MNNRTDKLCPLNQRSMSNEGYFKFLVMQSLDAYTELDGDDLMATAMAYASSMGSPLDYTLDYNIDMIREALKDAGCDWILDEHRVYTAPDSIDDGDDLLHYILMEHCLDLGITLD